MARTKTNGTASTATKAESELAQLKRRYGSLKRWLLTNSIIRFHEMPLTDSEPFVMGEDFYGPTFEAAAPVYDFLFAELSFKLNS